MDQAVEEIMAKCNINGEIAEYGLFAPAHQETGKKPYWASREKTFKALQITSNTILDFKKRIRPLRVVLVDGTAKVIAIDDSATVRDIADAVGDKIGIKSLEEFSLRRVTQPGMSKARMDFYLLFALVFIRSDLAAGPLYAARARRGSGRDPRVRQEVFLLR
jgi:hypothetical protein